MKIIPGVRLNFGKRSISVSAGGRGATMTLGKNGLYGNVGLPGSGLSVRSKLAGGSSSQPRFPQQSNPTASSSSGKVNVGVQLNLDDSGYVTIKDEMGNPLTPKYQKMLREQQGGMIQNWLEQQCEHWNKEIDDILNLHIETPPPSAPITFDPEPFEDMQPDQPTPCSAGFWGLLFKSKRETAERKNAQAMREYEQRLKLWREAKAAHEAREARRKWLVDVGRLQDREAMEEFLEDRLNRIGWPRETTVTFEISDDGRRVILDTDLPEVEDMPTETATVAARGYKINVKKRTDTQVRNEYVGHVHAIAFRVIGETFVALPKAEKVIFSGYSQRPDKLNGHPRDTYLLSITAERSKWAGLHFANLQLLDHVACFDLFEVRRELSKSWVLNPIVPFGPANL